MRVIGITFAICLVVLSGAGSVSADTLYAGLAVTGTPFIVSIDPVTLDTTGGFDATLLPTGLAVFGDSFYATSGHTLTRYAADGTVLNTFSSVILDWGDLAVVESTSAVPEPDTFVLLSIALVFGLTAKSIAINRLSARRLYQGMARQRG